MRWRFVFSLRTFICCVVVVGLLTIAVSKYLREVRVARHIQQLGGEVIWNGRRDVWTWNKLLQRVDGIYFTGSKNVEKETIALITQLAQPKQVGLAMTSVDDQSLAMIRKVTSITDLNLTSTAITDAGIRHLHELKGIRNLELDHTKVSYEALERLRNQLPLLHRDFVSEFAQRRCKELGASIRSYSKGPMYVVVDDEEEREDVLEHAKWIPAEVRSKDEVSEDRADWTNRLDASASSADAP